MFWQVLSQGAGGCINRSFAYPASLALAHIRQHLQHTPEESCKVVKDIDSVLRLLEGPYSLAVIDNDDQVQYQVCEVLEPARTEGLDELEEI